MSLCRQPDCACEEVCEGFIPWDLWGTEHRCQDGAWKKGKAGDCPVCKAKRRPLTVKRNGES